MNSISGFRRRTQRNGVTPKEKMVNELKRNFNKQIDESLAGFEVQATVPDEVNITENTRTIKCLINNITLNDQRNLDEKYLHVNVDEDIEVGCYVKWQNSYWLLIFMEHNSIESHRTFVMRRCNSIVNHRLNGVVWEIPVSIMNLTMYSDGLADLKMTSQADSKRHISYGSNPVTRTLKLGHRIMLGHETVFRITHINDFEYNSKFTGSDGLIRALVLNTSFIEGDDKENGIAYNDQSNLYIEEDSIIKGEKDICLGSISTYIVKSGYENYWFDIDLGTSKQEFATIIESEKGKCKIKVTSDSRYVGKTFKVYIHPSGNRNDIIESIEIKIVGL